MSVCNPAVHARSVGAGKALGVHPFRGAPPAFDLAPGTHRKRRWLHTRREGGGETAGETIKRGARRCRRRWTVVRNAPALEWAVQ
jgi:hypothetical protein